MLGLCVIFRSFTARFTLVILCFVILILLAWRKSVATKKLTEQFSYDDLPAWCAYLYLFILICTTVLIVLCANRSDFDDAEYIQFAIQTLRHPEKGLFSFDASLGVILDQFRFAPYRITSYETFIGLISQWTGINILDVYYLIVPSISATLSILVAFIFLRWFLPLRWSLLAVLLFLLISLAWGETHVAFGNRIYVRLFQGKSLLVAITTPLTIIMALIWMRKPNPSTWCGLLILQVAAIGSSSSGLVITLFSTVLGLLAGLFAQLSYKNCWVTSVGGITLFYPLGCGFWIKYMSNASGKVEEIGSYLPINASFGSSWRESLTITIIILACLINFRAIGNNLKETYNKHFLAYRTFFWLALLSFLIIINPLLIEQITSVTSKNMNWRLAWSAPVPLFLSVSIAYLIH